MISISHLSYLLVKSMFRQQLEEMVGMQGLALKLDAPEELIEDPTFELKRMQVKVIYSLFFGQKQNSFISKIRPYRPTRNVLTYLFASYTKMIYIDLNVSTLCLETW